VFRSFCILLPLSVIKLLPRKRRRREGTTMALPILRFWFQKGPHNHTPVFSSFFSTRVLSMFDKECRKEAEENILYSSRGRTAFRHRPGGLHFRVISCIKTEMKRTVIHRLKRTFWAEITSLYCSSDCYFESPQRRQSAHAFIGQV
jgi:hypothetical protein